MNKKEVQFIYTEALPFEPGITRRDPSPVVKVAEKYYVWYSKAYREIAGYAATIWCATSSDGLHWVEEGEAIEKGSKGSWDENGVFTPSILVTKERYYLFYTGVPVPFTNDNGGSNATATAIGIAMSHSPSGPWEKYDGNPVLKPGTLPEQWDSHRVDDACLLIRDGKYWLYYKGRQYSRTAAQTQMGVAIAEHPTGPYIKHEKNPLINSGHEVCVWPYRSGVATILAPIGPEGNTVQFSHDGITFSICAKSDSPQAPGPYRIDYDVSGSKEACISWGLCHEDRSHERPFLLRFDTKNLEIILSKFIGNPSII